MAAPNIEMIAASLRSCSLAGGDGGGGGGHSPPRPQQLAEACDESAGVITVELNSETTLPFHWEQRLDIRTGEIYYINWETGVRTTDDPRTTAATFSSADYYYFDGGGGGGGGDDAVSDEYSRVGTGDEDDYEGEEEDDDDDDTADSSSLSSTSPTEDPDGSGPVLVAAGCKACFMYFMVPKRVDACPKCGCALLHLGRNGCF